jgi:hypothetical protein
LDEFGGQGRFFASKATLDSLPAKQTSALL